MILQTIYVFFPKIKRVADLVRLGRLAELESSVDSLVTELLLNSKELVVLGQSLGAAGSSSLDLAG